MNDPAVNFYLGQGGRVEAESRMQNETEGRMTARQLVEDALIGVALEEH